jgi:hypothetical protein
MVILHVAHVAQQRYTISYDDIVINGDPVSVTKIKPDLMPYMYILAYLTTQTSPDSRPQILLVQELEDIRLVSIVEDKAFPQRAERKHYQCEGIDSSMFLFIINQMEFLK